DESAPLLGALTPLLLRSGLHAVLGDGRALGELLRGHDDRGAELRRLLQSLELVGVLSIAPPPAPPPAEVTIEVTPPHPPPAAAPYGARPVPELRALYDRRLAGSTTLDDGEPEPMPAEQAQALFDEGSRAFQQRDFAGAQAAFERARELDPEHAEYSLHLGLAR